MKRIVVNRGDIQVLEQIGLHKSYRRWKDILAQLGKSEGEPVSVGEYARLIKTDQQIVFQALHGK